MKKLLIPVICFFVIAKVFSQGITYNNEFQIDTYTWYSDDHTDPCITGLSNGGFVVCWESEDMETSYDITAQIFDNNMEKFGSEFCVNTFTMGWQRKPNVCSIANGKFVVCWEDAGQTVGTGVYGQIYYDDGTKVGEEFQVNTYNEKWQENSSVSGLKDRNFVVCWISFEQDSDDYGIFAQLFNDKGIKIGHEFQVNTFTTDNQINPSVTNLKNGGFVICWESVWQSGYFLSVFGQVFDETGMKVGSEFQVNSLSGVAVNFSISSLLNGGFVICWESYDENGDENGIFSQLFNAEGVKVGNEFQVNSYLTNRETSPSIGLLQTGDIIISWESRGEIFAQLHTGNGVKIGTEFQVNHFTGHSQSKPIISGLTNNKFIICWQSDGQHLFTDGIYANYYLNEPIYHLLKDFELLEPKLDSTLVIDSAVLNWGKATSIHINFPWELTYDLYIDTDESFSNPLVTAGIQDTSYQMDSLIPDKTYFWKILARNISRDSLWSSNVNGFYIDPDAVTDVDKIKSSVPEQFKLFQNYPNPFNPTTKIHYSIPDLGTENFRSVQLKVYNVLGKLVATLVNQKQPYGSYEVEFKGNELPSGVYFYRIVTDKYSETKKMILMR